MRPSITLTPSASKHISKMIESKHGVGFRLTVKKTGCSGYSYQPSVIDQPSAADIKLDVNGIQIFLDPAWANVLDGITVDYTEASKSGLMQKQLVITNQKESGRCGCGESFHLE